MRKEAEGGAIGSAQALAYTRPLIAGVQLLSLVFIIYDLVAGRALCRAALHFESKIWTAVFLLLAGWLPCGLATSAVSLAYTRYTGVTYVQDRVGFARSGGSDIAFWTGFASFLSTVTLSYYLGMPGWSGATRGLAVLLVAIVASVTLSSIISRFLFVRMFGPKVQGSLWMG